MAFISNGTTILDNGAFDVSLGGLEFISEATASSSASIEFTSGIDSTYDIYKFEFINIHPQTDSVDFTFQGSTDSGSSYGITLTSTAFVAFHNEADTSTGLDYQSGDDLAQSTSFQRLTHATSTGNANDECVNGILQIFNPSSTTFVKHFLSTTSGNHASDYELNTFIAGYFNSTSAIDAIQFKMSSGNIDAGTIKMYGIKGS